YLRFIENLGLADTADILTKQLRLRRRLKNPFHPGLGRLARGGLLPRVMDALFTLSFLLRGRVPAVSAAAAEIDYFHLRAQRESFNYYGRVARQSHWTVLQYWFFYCYNNWRSGFGGVNDHESDWEMISIYLYEADGQLVPEWVAYASHDYQGDDLRRRWDDADQLDLEGGHPVVYAGAGSHASYFRKGEYQAEVDLDLPGWLEWLRRTWNAFWTQMLGQRPADPFHIPFVDYARGDGMKIGPGHTRTWDPILVDSSVTWINQYRGLWGLFARDPISGENAPAGPMYNRDGSPRNAWYDPLGFAGLDKVPPPPEVQRLLEKNRVEVTSRQAALKTTIPDKATELQSLGIRLKSMEGNPHLAKQYSAMQRRMATMAEEVRGLRREYSENFALLESMGARLERQSRGLRDDPRSHIRHLAQASPSTRQRFDRLGEAWAAVSLSMLLFAVVGLLFVAPRYLGAGLVFTTIFFVLVESILRGAFIQTVSEVTALLAIIACVILMVHFWYWLLVGMLLAIALFLLLQRLRELTG
ncbi:MAG TPA: hypothetical protein VFH29_05740, partial [Anaerolineales bacterium]|nr:hypothetical protein [Anaerolineales bacterium]